MNLGTILIYLFFIILALFIFFLAWPFFLYMQVYIDLKKIHFKLQIRLRPEKFTIFKREWKWASIYPDDEIKGKIDFKKLWKASKNKDNETRNRKLLNKLLELKFTVYTFKWITNIGFNNPAVTSMVYGFLWMVKSIIFRAIDYRFKFTKGKENYNYDIKVDFENIQAYSQLDCILLLPKGHDILRIMLK